MNREKLALKGGQPVRTSPFPAWPVLGDEDKKAVEKVLESGKLTCLTGQKVKEFEDKFANYHGVKHAIAVRCSCSYFYWNSYSSATSKCDTGICRCRFGHL